MVASEIRNYVLKNCAGQTRNGFCYYTEKSAPFADFCVPLARCRTNGTDFLLKMRFDRTAKNNNNRKTFYRSIASCFGMSFQKFFLLLSGSERNYCVFLFCKVFGIEFRAFFSSEEWSEQNYEVPHVFSSLNGILSCFVFCGMARNNSERFRSAKQQDFRQH